MVHRIAIASLWFAAFLCLHELAWSVFGSPRLLGLVFGGLAAAFIFFDPARLSASRTVASESSTV